jgi:hypothetical protein
VQLLTVKDMPAPELPGSKEARSRKSMANANSGRGRCAAECGGWHHYQVVKLGSWR